MEKEARQTAGIRGRALIVNLPGRPKAIRENLEAVFPAIPYCIDLVADVRLETNDAVIKAFRPGGAKMVPETNDQERKT